MKISGRILSTKKLLGNQKHFLLNAGFSVIEAAFIKIKNIRPELNDIKQNLIFTSRNAVKSILEIKNSEFLSAKNCFCVGQKTKLFLENNGFNVIACSDYAKDLAAMIAKYHQSESFTFFSGNLRQDVLPELLKKENIDFNEIEVYQTVLKPNKINIQLDGILFFSPSAVESYLKENKITDETCFCIGNSTAKILEKTTENIIIANQPSVENTIIQCINHYKNA